MLVTMDVEKVDLEKVDVEARLERPVFEVFEVLVVLEVLVG